MSSSSKFSHHDYPRRRWLIPLWILLLLLHHHTFACFDSISTPLQDLFSIPTFPFLFIIQSYPNCFSSSFFSYMIIDVIFSFYSSSSSSMSSLESFFLSLIQGVSSVMEGMMWIINNVSCLDCQNEWNTIYRHLCLNMIFIFSTFHAWKYFLLFI